MNKTNIPVHVNVAESLADASKAFFVNLIMSQMYSYAVVTILYTLETKNLPRIHISMLSILVQFCNSVFSAVAAERVS